MFTPCRPQWLLIFKPETQIQHFMVARMQAAIYAILKSLWWGRLHKRHLPHVLDEKKNWRTLHTWPMLADAIGSSSKDRNWARQFGPSSVVMVFINWLFGMTSAPCLTFSSARSSCHKYRNQIQKCNIMHIRNFCEVFPLSSAKTSSDWRNNFELFVTQ